MARNRVIYQSEALYVSKEATSTGDADHEQLDRVQSANYSFNISRQDVNQFGQLGKVGSMVLEAPTVSTDTSYLVTNGFNERALGFYVQTGSEAEGSFISGHLNDGSGQNLFIKTVGEGTDANGASAAAGDDVLGIGNAYLTDYTLDLSVGSLPTASVSFEAANIQSSAGTSIGNPAVVQSDGSPVAGNISLPAAISGTSSTIALRPGDITVDLDAADGQTVVDIGTPDSDSAHIQSASLSVPLSRSPLERLGTKFAYARSVDFPVQATLSVSAIVNELKAKELTAIIDDESTKTITLTLKDEAGTAAMIYKMKGAQIVSESFSSSIGSNKTVDLTFATSLSGPNDLTNGVFVSGANDTATFA
tara:strand:+ start:13 stop:1101 length:1089 start_codon:yes stop_codon:yes gene_type:complete